MGKHSDNSSARAEQRAARAEILSEIHRVLEHAPDECDPSIVLVGAVREYLTAELLIEQAEATEGD